MIELSTASSNDLKDILADCFNSTAVLAKTLFPERFELPFAEKIHNKIFEIIDDWSIQRCAIAAPRGCGKTSITNLVVPARNILFRESKYIVPVSCTSTQAVQQSESLKYELMTNEDIVRLFGSMKSGEFSKEQWRAENGWTPEGSNRVFPGTGVMPRGAGQQIRGLLYLGFRPDLIIVDDLEDPENIDSEEMRLKKRRWFFADLCKAIARYKKDWRIIVLGTILHQDSLIARLLEDPDWESVTLELCDDNLKSNWPEFMSDKEIKREYDEAKRQGMIDVFYRENRNMAVSKETAGFKAEYFKYYEEGEEDLNNDPNSVTVVIIDPAKTVKMESAETGIVGWTCNMLNQKMYVRDCIGEKLYPDQVYDEALKMAERLNAQAIGIEVTSLEEFILQPFKNEMLRRGLHFEVIELKARGGQGGKGKGKEMRVRSLVYVYRQGLVYHNESACVALESQLLSFPHAKRWDLMDAAAYIIEILEKGLMYMSPKEGEEESADSIEAEYLALEKTYDSVPLQYGII